MHDACAAPQQHVGIGAALDVAAEVLVRRPQDLLAIGGQMLDDGQGNAAGHHPIGQRLHLHGGVGVDDHGPVRVFVAEGFEILRRTAKVQGALRLQRRHEHLFVGRQDFRRLAHEANAGDDQGAGRMVTAKAGHLQGVGNESAGFLSQILHIAVHVVVRHQHGIARLEQFSDARLQPPALGVFKHGGHVLRNALGGEAVIGEGQGPSLRNPSGNSV